MRRVSQRLLGKTGKRGGTPPEVCPSGSRQCDWEALSTVSEADLFAQQELSLETVPFNLRSTIEDAMGPFVVEAQQKGYPQPSGSTGGGADNHHHSPGPGTDIASGVRTLPRNGRSLRVLLAEDHVVNQMIATFLMRSQGYTVEVAATGFQALKMLDEQAFDLVLMDIQMPEMDGLEATAKIREREVKTGEHIPIIAVTARAMAGDRERCLDGGMDDYVSKPIQPSEMWAAIKRVLPCSGE